MLKTEAGDIIGTHVRLEPLAVDIPTAYRAIGVGRSMFYELLATGQIRSVKVGKRRLIPVDSLREWLRGLEGGAA